MKRLAMCAVAVCAALFCASGAEAFDPEEVINDPVVQAYWSCLSDAVESFVRVSTEPADTDRQRRYRQVPQRAPGSRQGDRRARVNSSLSRYGVHRERLSRRGDRLHPRNPRWNHRSRRARIRRTTGYVKRQMVRRAVAVRYRSFGRGLQIAYRHFHTQNRRRRPQAFDRHLPQWLFRRNDVEGRQMVPRRATLITTDSSLSAVRPHEEKWRHGT